MRHIIVGDVHGCFGELFELLEKVKHDPKKDRLAFVGDILDRGPDPVGAFGWVRMMVEQGCADLVFSNHEEKHLRYHDHTLKCRVSGKKHPMKAFPEKTQEEHDRLTDSDFEFIRKLPLYHRFVSGGRQFLVSHAGIPTVSYVDEMDGSYRRRAIRTRYVDAWTGEYASTGDAHEVPPGAVFWTERWGINKLGSDPFGHTPVNVFYGHIVGGIENPRIDIRPDSSVCYGIDTGCVFGGRLTAAVIEDGRLRFVQVQAPKTYYGTKGHPHPTGWKQEGTEE